MFFTRISEIKRKKSESYIGFDKSTSTLEERLQAHLRRLSPYPFGSVGKGLERETLLPFPRLRGSGTHYETGPGFLLLFSIKSKGEHLCFATRVLNWRISYLHQIFYYPLHEKGQNKTPSSKGRGVFLTFSLFHSAFSWFCLRW